MTNNKSAITAAAILISLSFAACGQSVSDRAKNDQVTDVRDGDPAMERAFEKARATLDDFFRQLKSPKEGTSAYAVKVALTDGKETEYFWVNELVVDGDTLSGVLNNEPEIVKTRRMGERFSFKRGEVVDWTYMDANERRMYGNYTACALLTHEDSKEAAEFKEQYGLRCD